MAIGKSKSKSKVEVKFTEEVGSGVGESTVDDTVEKKPEIVHPNVDLSRLCEDVNEKPKKKQQCKWHKVGWGWWINSFNFPFSPCIVPTIDHPNIDTSKTKGCPAKSGQSSDTKLREPETADSDDEFGVFIDHPNLHFSRNYKVMNQINPPCLFVCHPNMSANRLTKFQSCLGCQHIDSPKKSSSCKCPEVKPKPPCKPKTPVKTSNCPEVQALLTRKSSTKDCHTETETQSNRPQSAKSTQKCQSQVSFCNQAPSMPAFDCHAVLKKPAKSEKKCGEKVQQPPEEESCSPSCSGCGKPVELQPICQSSNKSVPKKLKKPRTPAKRTESKGSCCQKSCEGRIKWIEVWNSEHFTHFVFHSSPSFQRRLACCAQKWSIRRLRCALWLSKTLSWWNPNRRSLAVNAHQIDRKVVHRVEV